MSPFPALASLDGSDDIRDALGTLSELELALLSERCEPGSCRI